MIVLALDTTLFAASAAVLRDGVVLAVHSEPMERGHSERIGGVVRDVMAKSGVVFRDLNRIGVTVGPGSFTGLRVGLAFGKGLAAALDIPCVGVGTLEALAGSTGARGPVGAVIDARRGQVYAQAFSDGAALTAPAVLSIEAARSSLSDVRVLVGPGASLLSDYIATDPRPFADPAAIARLAAGAVAPLARAAPLYLRAPDAKTIAERAAG